MAEPNKKKIVPWKCDNDHVYIAFENSCVFCEHGDVFWDYTNGPYLIRCGIYCNTEHGMSGQCGAYKEIK